MRNRPSLVCAGCKRQATAVLPLFCEFCGFRFPPPRALPSAAGLDKLDRAAARKAELAGKSTSTVKRHASVQAQFQRFLAEIGVPGGDIMLALPGDVVDFLISKDATAGTVVHVGSCRFFGSNTKQRSYDCACPARAAAGSVKTTWSSIRAVYRDAGVSGPFVDATQSGNPANAALVKAYVRSLNREQTHAAIAPEQSEVFSRAVMLTVLAKLSDDVMLAVRNDEFAVALDLALRLCFLSACWNTGLRAEEVRVARPGQIGFGGLSFQVTVTKTSQGASGIRSIPLADTGDALSFPVAVGLFNSCIELAGIEFPRDYFFQSFKRGAPKRSELVWCAEPVSHSTLDNFWRARVRALGITRRVTLHSIHGSSAAHDREMGILPEVTMARIGWTRESYELYTAGRDLVRLPTEPPRRC